MPYTIIIYFIHFPVKLYTIIIPKNCLYCGTISASYCCCIDPKLLTGLQEIVTTIIFRSTQIVGLQGVKRIAMMLPSQRIRLYKGRQNNKKRWTNLNSDNFIFKNPREHQKNTIRVDMDKQITIHT